MTQVKAMAWMSVLSLIGLAPASVRADVGADMVTAAKAVTKAFTGQAAEKLTFEFGAAERLNWHFIPRGRKGVPIKEMNDPQRKLAQQAPKIKTRVPLKGWCYLDKKREAAMPVVTTEPCDDAKPRERKRFFTHQIKTLGIADFQ